MQKLVLSALCALTLIACSQLATPPQDTAIWPHDASDLAADPAVRYGRLDNGMRYAVLTNTTPPQQASLRLYIGSGSLDEDDDQRGLAHFLEHMAFNGSEGVPEGEMIKILERHGLAFGPDTNAFTSFDQTVYMLELPEVSDAVLDDAFFLMREAAGRLTLAADAIDRERGVVLSEMRASSTPGFSNAKALFEFLMPGALPPRRFPIGDAGVLENAPRERFAAFYDAHYTPENALFVAVGDMEEAALIAWIEAAFGDWPVSAATPEEPDAGTINPDRGIEAGVFVDPDLPTQISMYALKPVLERPDTVETRREGVLNGLGNAMLNRRLAKLARAEDAVILGAGASFDEQFGVADMASLGMVSETQDWAAALAVGEQELRKAIEHGFSQAELDEQIAELRGTLVRGVEQAGTRSSSGLASQLVAAFNDGSVFTHPSSSLERFEAMAAEITPVAVLAAFRAPWEGVEPLVFIGTSEPIEGGEEAVLDAYRASRAIAVTAPEASEGQGFAYEDFGAPGQVVSRAEAEDLGLVMIRFENGVMLNLKATDFEDNAVRAQVRFGGGKLEQAREQAGVDFLVGNAFAAGGLEAHSLDDIDSLMAGRALSLQLSVGSDAFSYGARVSGDDLLPQLQLWAAYMTTPGYRPEGLAQFRKVLDVILPTLDATPQSVIGTCVGALIRSGDPRYGLPPEEALLALDLDDLQAFVDEPMAQAAIEITLVGALEEAQAVDLVARTFGALPARETERRSYDEGRGLSFPQGGGERVLLRHAGEANRAAALVYWPTTDGRDIRTARALSLLGSVMQLKLTDILREETGATYSPNAGTFSDREHADYGYITASADLRPEDVPDAFARIAAIAADMSGGGISADELERARRPILESIEEGRERNGYWSGALAEAQTQPESLDNVRSVMSDYEAISLEELKTLAARYLTPETAYRIEVLPPESQ